ncbi:MAG TPA: glycoside hydrolase family 57 protein, partial [Bacteroidales bacterium]|nr:glycoside hydrolase family 57 protein [Bacteroidales bacterium]
LVKRLADFCYLPANKMFLDLLKKYEDISLSFSISGDSIQLFKEHAPEVIESFKELIATNRVEIVGNTFSHSIASLYGKDAFMHQIKKQEKQLKEVFDVTPVSFCNTELIYSDEIGEWLAEAGYKVVLTEGARHILAWKSAGYLYCNPFQTNLKVLMRNYNLCDDITLRFQNKSWEHYPLTADKYLSFLNNIPHDAPYINLFMDYETIGEYHTKESGIFDFFYHLFVQIAERKELSFMLPQDVAKEEDSVLTIHVPWAMSSSSDEKDTNEWLGNELQQEAFEQLFKLENLYKESKNENAKMNWLRLQAADHFAFMSTKWFAETSVKRNFDVYPSPYQAFINYMNVLNDVKLQLEKKK